jgi:membrane fusion protein (multidrug efflux system)
MPALETPAPDHESTPPAAAPAAGPARRVLIKRLLVGICLAAALIAGGRYGSSYWTWSQVHESTDNAFIDGRIVQVSARVNGHVAKVFAQDNQLVRAGEVLFEIDAADYQAILDEAHGRLAAAKANLGATQNVVKEAQAQVTAAEANVAQAKAEETRQGAELERARADLTQYEKARDSGALSNLEFGKADTGFQTARAAANAAGKAVAAAEAQVGQARSALEARQGEVAVAEAQIKSAEAAVERAALNLSYTRVTASIDGRVTRKSVEPGSYVIPGQPLLALVSPEMWVTANFKETQLAHMRAGQRVELEVDAYPGMKLEGHIESIQQGAGARFSLLPPENATGNYVKVVQRVPVKIILDRIPEDGRVLGPGMSVVPIVHTAGE